MTNKQLTKLVFAIFALTYFLYYSSTSTSWHFIDNFNLLMHEAGHWIFSLFGYFMTVLGGSLNQVLIPAIFSAYFFFQHQPYSGSLVLFWVGQNLINVSVYAGDAVRMQLPLLGGDESGHDWNWLLLKTGLFHHTDLVANIIYFSGLIIILTAGILSIIYSLKQDETTSS